MTDRDKYYPFGLNHIQGIFEVDPNTIPIDSTGNSVYYNKYGRNIRFDMKPDDPYDAYQDFIGCGLPLTNRFNYYDNKKMRIFIICTVLFFTSSCKAQNNQNLHLEIISFFKINEKDIQRCQKDREELLKYKMNITTIETAYDQCITYYDYLNFYRDNTLKMLKKHLVIKIF
ncbi:hypothetical protein ACKW6Q_12815 [Chryseobacterium kwangjuense]|uniref:RHS repeat-associated core domain-containing protein n=1 Tax=Chryseobacterium kwangjuense TaxID=267125 RepID=A0ABW9K3Y1_9FLAO